MKRALNVTIDSDFIELLNQKHLNRIIEEKRRTSFSKFIEKILEQGIGADKKSEK